ncbi:unnamed protein product [Rotaria magnacalcarata]|uniref:CRAL-TRIO domain-containing protein n=1 Tax=Rotaria magnacalcarata TaxID=392030 RepID=A0A816SS08_9BILA|nr:unnamed protein product [Rotaria magnacalcarata]CAF1465019.1 unnamed protein product [Rotaria magnacalcarata]CAF2084150.1 unnamed protein product [Rotaria magnacalcarata]CAF2231877.1 unnamed protein product [Rotaria magnacalcarata]CAF4001641.1 unnamed protein product [Rotaria magnacalcarata]
MTSNDPGHINNLSRAQANALKQSWVALIEDIGKETSLSGEHIADSVFGDELFRAICYDNPDVLILRWLRSRKWNVDASVNQIIETLKWRHDWGVQELVANGERAISQEEIATGKTYFMGHDKIGRPVCCIHPKEHVKGKFSSEYSEKLSVLCVETYRKLLQPPIESVTIIFDMAGCERKNMDMHQIKFLVTLLDNYYPDSLGMILVLNFPWIFDKSWLLIKSWLNPTVQQKVRFIHSEAELTEFIDPSVLPKRLYGTQPDFKYIPPSAEDEAIFNIFRADTKGKAIAEAAHRDAVRYYLRVTLQWANGNESRNVLVERKKARKQLKNAFEQLSPYISTRTHYHRAGVIKEPIFQIAYERLLHEKEESSVTFF